jgi:putative ABC transport system permease protein
MQNLWQDLRYGARMLTKQPGFTLIAALTLALGIGANTAIFSVVNGVLLRPLPFDEAERLVRVYVTAPARGIRANPASYLNFADWRAQNSVFDAIAAYSGASATFTGGAAPEQIEGVAASGDLFAVLKARPSAGRVFSSADEQQGNKNIVVISHGLWQRSFGGDPKIVGRQVTLDATGYTVIGVMPRGFRFPLEQRKTDYWVPLDPRSETNQERGANYLNVTARLKPGVNLEQAWAEMTSIAGRLEQQYHDKNAGRGLNLVPLHEALTGNLRRALLVLLAAVGFVLLIACANVANLQLARAASRGREMAIRAALGAGRGRILRQLLTESLMIAALGGAIGLLLAAWGVDLLAAAMPEDIPRAGGIGLDARVLGFTAAITLGAGLAFGLAPALQSSKGDLTASLKEGGRGAGAGAGHSRMRGLLVVTEVALSLVLLVGAGLLLKSFRHLLDVPPGFDPNGVLTATVALPSGAYREEARQSAFFEQALNRIAALPGVAAAGVVDPMPLGGSAAMNGFSVEGRPPQSAGERPATNSRIISADYLKAMGIPLLRGRALSERDNAAAPRTMLINESFARRYFPNENPLGQRLRLTIAPNFVAEVVGVAGDVKHRGLDREAGPEAYVSYLQVPAPIMSLVVRAAAGDPLNLAASVRQAVEQVDKDQPLADVKPMTAWLDESVARQRFNMLLLAVFAAVALLLAAIGIYGVVSYSVTERTREIGIRVALGAQRADVLRLVVRQGLALTLAGVACGVAGAFGLTRLMAGLLFSVTPTDPLTYVGVAALLVSVALLACWIPARRATKVDPMIALRCE